MALTIHLGFHIACLDADKPLEVRRDSPKKFIDVHSIWNDKLDKFDYINDNNNDKDDSNKIYSLS